MVIDGKSNRPPPPPPSSPSPRRHRRRVGEQARDTAQAGFLLHRRDHTLRTRPSSWAFWDRPEGALPVTVIGDHHQVVS